MDQALWQVWTVLHHEGEEAWKMSWVGKVRAVGAAYPRRQDRN